MYVIQINDKKEEKTNVWIMISKKVKLYYKLLQSFVYRCTYITHLNILSWLGIKMKITNLTDDNVDQF